MEKVLTETLVSPPLAEQGLELLCRLVDIKLPMGITSKKIGTALGRFIPKSD
ncbi:MAG: hypothetical protein ACLQBD_25170 [Syntrophobacteraceae bacterium]